MNCIHGTAAAHRGRAIQAARHAAVLGLVFAGLGCGDPSLTHPQHGDVRAPGPVTTPDAPAVAAGQRLALLSNDELLDRVSLDLSRVRRIASVADLEAAWRPSAERLELEAEVTRRGGALLDQVQERLEGDVSGDRRPMLIALQWLGWDAVTSALSHLDSTNWRTGELFVLSLMLKELPRPLDVAHVDTLLRSPQEILRLQGVGCLSRCRPSDARDRLDRVMSMDSSERIRSAARLERLNLE